jgi:histidine triad (HIT) family protein
MGMRVAAALRTCGVRCEGVNLFLADGEAAGQEVFHVHLHVFPRFAGDGFGLKFSPKYFVLPLRSELDNIAREIRNLIPA